MTDHKHQETLRTLVFFSLSAGLLTLIQAPFDAHFLAWIALVPFAMVCAPEVRTWRLVWTSYIVSLVYWIGNLYWIGYVTVPGYVLFSIILALYWPVLALSVRYIQRKGLPLFACLPILFVGAEAWQGLLFTGFSWRLLGHSQYQNLTVIQIADIFGALGVSFLVGMVNGLITDLGISLTQGKVMRFSNLFKVAMVGAAVFCTVDYGRMRLDETPLHLTEGPAVGSVQPNIPSHIKEEVESGEKIMDELLISSEKCYQAGAEMVAWPETIVLATMNKDFLRHLKPGSRALKFNDRISEFVSGKGYLLMGAHSAEVGIRDGKYDVTDRWNSALLYKPNGKQAAQRYDKIHLVPFGEFIPFRGTFIADFITWLSPYDYDYSLEHGDEYTVFEMDSSKGKFNFGAMICYEDTDPRIIRRIVGTQGVKRADWLVNLSNDGWYVRFDNGKIIPSVELPQRTAITVFRCVENRIPVIRSVNTGISCLIDSTGKIRDGYVEGNLPVEAMERQGVGGYFVDNIPVDSRITFFSKYGQKLDIVCGAAFALTALIVLVADFKRYRHEKRTA
ncbi:Apolipoprotein N-acyltransferase [Anaerohalosphaera lusitana]|uniref:Apolipoprotein N-acyltransferase n=1 Tax=Anaerohalosphaera lusitana TaxID=1936003 RepID=A0A1U9NR59_9BACT|nr:apolipoprotein N-acyltransferase [Anaerohalosphaera lusitana]AQT70110.1 Apolipoprotein N-acyltransferase [Anaerohalosphaera lusitana]